MSKEEKEKNKTMNIRIMIILFLILMILIYIAVFYFLKTLDITVYQKLTNAAQLYHMLEFGGWIIICIVLWLFQPFGSVLYILFSILSFYDFKYLPEFASMLSDEVLWKTGLLLISLMIGKHMLSIACSYHLCEIVLFHRGQKEITAQKGVKGDEQTSEKTEEKLTKAVKNSYLRGFFLLLFINVCLLLMEHFGMSKIIQLFADDKEGLYYVQNKMMMIYLFGCLVWTPTAVALLLYVKRIYTFFRLTWGFEFLYFIWNLPQIFQQFSLQEFRLPSILAMILLIVIRYMILIKVTKIICNNKQIKSYCLG